MHDTAKDHFRYLLQNQRNDLVARVESLDAQLREGMKDITNEDSMYDNHPGDLGSELFEREKDIGLRSGFKGRIDEVDMALEALDDGTYGICMACGRPIPAERLEAVPETQQCTDCRQSFENRPDTNVRPVEEDVLRPGFGRYNFDDNDAYNGFDGEDAFQAVAQYGTSESPSDLPGTREYDDLYRDDERIGGVEEVELVIDENGEALEPE